LMVGPDVQLELTFEGVHPLSAKPADKAAKPAPATPAPAAAPVKKSAY
jgi:hypothetical protein